jgi:hypothetical protein
MASGGPGKRWHKIPQDLKGRDRTTALFQPDVPRFQRGTNFFANLDLGLRALRFAPGCYIAGFQPGNCASSRASPSEAITLSLHKCLKGQKRRRIGLGAFPVSVRRDFGQSA